MAKVLNKLLLTITTIILILTVAIGLKVLIESIINPNKIPSIFGWKMFIMQEDDQNLQMQYGDLLFTKETNTNALKAGDIIAFKTNNNHVMIQKIINKQTENGITGFEVNDAYKAPNESIINNVSQDQVEGLYINKIPEIGKIGLFLQRPEGLIKAISIPLTIILITTMIDTKTKDPEAKKENTAKSHT